MTEHSQSGMGVQVNEAGAYDVACGVYDLRGFQIGHVSPVYGDDLVLYTDGGVESRTGSTVNHEAVDYEQIEHHSLLI